MAQAAKQLKKIKDIEAQALQEQKEKEESNRKRRNRSRDRKKKVSGAGVAALQWACAVAESVAVPGALQGGHRAAWSLCVCASPWNSLSNTGQLSGAEICCLP